MEKLGKVQLDTSRVKEAAIKMVGEKKLFEDLWKKWEKFRDDETGGRRTRLGFGKGVKGGSGIQGSFRKLCDGKVEGGVGLVHIL